MKEKLNPNIALHLTSIQQLECSPYSRIFHPACWDTGSLFSVKTTVQVYLNCAEVYF